MLDPHDLPEYGLQPKPGSILEVVFLRRVAPKSEITLPPDTLLASRIASAGVDKTIEPVAIVRAI